MSDNNKSPALSHYIIAGAMAWGRGTTYQDALLNWVKQASSWQLGSRDVELKVWQVDEKAYIDGMGALCYQRMHELPTVLVTNDFRKKFEDIEGDIEEMFLPHCDEELFD